MNKELFLIIAPGLGLILFALGGTQISEQIKGQKWLRRFLLPFIFGICVFWAGFALWQACSVAILSCVVFHLGYGDKAPIWLKIAVFAGFGAISLPIGISWWNLITFVVAGVLFLFSNLKLLSKTIVHKVWEGLTGAVIGIQIGYLLAGNGLIWRL